MEDSKRNGQRAAEIDVKMNSLTASILLWPVLVATEKEAINKNLRFNYRQAKSGADSIVTRASECTIGGLLLFRIFRPQTKTLVHHFVLVRILAAIFAFFERILRVSAVQPQLGSETHGIGI